MINKLTEMIKTGINGNLPKATAEKIAPKIAESLIKSKKVIVLPCEENTAGWCLVTPCGGCEEEELSLRGIEHCQQCRKLVIEKLPFSLDMVHEVGEYVFMTEEEAIEKLEKGR